MVGQSRSQSSAGFDLERPKRLVGLVSDRRETTAASFQVPWYVYQTQMGRLRSSWRAEPASEEKGVGGWLVGGEGREENKNKQRLIVHKSRRSIVSGEPPAALADGVPMKRSKHGCRLGSAATHLAGWVGRSPTCRSQELRNKAASGTFPESSGFISPAQSVFKGEANLSSNHICYC